jgi:tetratricopeptide (TPR) repeat protein
MRKIIISIFLVLTFLCSPAMSETAMDWVHKATALWKPNGETTFTNPKKAIDYLNKAIKMQPDFADAYWIRGLAYADLGQYQRAIEDYNKSMRLKPNDLIYNHRGLAYRNLGQYQLCIEEYNEAIRLKSVEADAYYERGICYYKQGKNQLGCNDARKACALGNCKLLELAHTAGACP